jgi:hypothetical protein
MTYCREEYLTARAEVTPERPGRSDASGQMRSSGETTLLEVPYFQWLLLARTCLEGHTGNRFLAHVENISKRRFQFSTGDRSDKSDGSHYLPSLKTFLGAPPVETDSDQIFPSASKLSSNAWAASALGQIRVRCTSRAVIPAGLSTRGREHEGSVLEFRIPGYFWSGFAFSCQPASWQPTP